MKPIYTQFNSIRSLADRSFRLTFDTQEADGELIAEITKRVHSQGFLAFLENSAEVDTLQVPEAPPSKEKKSQSKKLREVLYRYWERETNMSQDFEDFYVAETTKIINHYLNKISP